ncbi:hypothetical protein B566_EDAN010167 [Ephemera danica]|nr:hypothetical protein B566_EDAN010167 [Ephemera danica]
MCDVPQAVVHTSTLFSNCQNTELLEEVYPCAADPERLIQCAEWMDDKWINAFSPMLLEGRPNTYVYTKHLAEKLVGDAAKTLPIAIFRPSIGVPGVQLHAAHRPRNDVESVHGRFPSVPGHVSVQHGAQHAHLFPHRLHPDSAHAADLPAPLGLPR